MRKYILQTPAAITHTNITCWQMADDIEKKIYRKRFLTCVQQQIWHQIGDMFRDTGGVIHMIFKKKNRLIPVIDVSWHTLSVKRTPALPFQRWTAAQESDIVNAARSQQRWRSSAWRCRDLPSVAPGGPTKTADYLSRRILTTLLPSRAASLALPLGEPRRRTI